MPKKKVTHTDIYPKQYIQKPEVHQAVRHLNLALDNFFNIAVIYDKKQALANKDHQQTVHVIKAPAGLGKTEAVLNRLTGQEWIGKRVLYLVPTIQLADELHAKCQQKGLLSRVIRGRSQPLAQADIERNREMGDQHPHIQIYDGFTEEQKQTGKSDQDGKAIIWKPAIDRMCSKWELAESMATNNINVSTALCEKKTGEIDQDGNHIVIRCPFFETCPYQLQKQNKEPGILIGAHQYLTMTMETISDNNIHLLIIDESFWASLVKKSTIRSDRLLDLKRIKNRDLGRDRNLADERNEQLETEHMRNIVRRFREVLDSGIEWTIQDVMDQGFDDKSFIEAKVYEYSLMREDDINPGDSYRKHNDFITNRIVSEALKFGRFWDIVASEIKSGRRGKFNGLKMELDSHDSDGVANRIIMRYHSKVRYQDVPVLIIDADANENILTPFFQAGISSFTDIQVRWGEVYTYQNVNGAYSKLKLLGARGNDRSIGSALNNRARLHNFMKTLSWVHRNAIAEDPSTKPLLITYMDVEDCLKREFPDLLNSYDIDHFQNIRGKDIWKNTRAIVIAGRPLPSAEEVEGIARAIYYNSDVEINILSRFLTQQKPIVFTYDHAINVECYGVEDPRVNDVLEQIRDAELTQAIARCRPIHRTDDNPCEIFILTDVPLDIPVDKPLFLSKAVLDNDIKNIQDGVIYTPSTRRTATTPRNYVRENRIETGDDVVMIQATKRWNGCLIHYPQIGGIAFDVEFIKAVVSRNRKANPITLYIAISQSETLQQVQDRIAELTNMERDGRVRFPEMDLMGMALLN